MSASVPTEIILASSPAGNAVLHVFDQAGNPMEAQIGERETLLNYCETRFPKITPREITR